MRIMYLVLTLLSLASNANFIDAAPPPSWITVPQVVPAPLPPPVPPPGAVPILPADSLYVVQSKGPAFAFLVPEGIASLTTYAGPLVVHGKFVGGSGDYEIKTFEGANVFLVTGVASGRVELAVTKVGAKSNADVFRQQIDCLKGPQPPPEPKPPEPKPPEPKPPDPTPAPPVPVPVKDLKVLIVYESAQLGVLPPSQHAILYSKPFREWLNSKTAMGPHGVHEWGIYDKDVDLSAYGPPWVEMMSKPKTSIPWLVLYGGGKFLHEGPLPANVDETKKVIDSWTK